MEINAIILAAGKGTRMNSKLPKCAHTILDQPMIQYVYNNLSATKPSEIITVVGYKQEYIRDILKDKTKYAVQDSQLGTAHAVMVAAPFLENKKAITIIAIGDMPLISKETYSSLLAAHLNQKNDLTILTTNHPNPFGYGRVIRDEAGKVLGIVEERDCTESQKLISEINSSIYVVDNVELFNGLKQITNDNAQQEYYLTDLVSVFRKQKLQIGTYTVLDHTEISGVNDKLQLVDMEQNLLEKIIEKHLLNGVTIENPASTLIGVNVAIEPDVIIRPGTIITGNTTIKAGAVIGPNSEVNNSVIDCGAHISNSILIDCKVAKNSLVGPFKYFKNGNL